ncbi:hypothetical protein SEA_TENNO_83 [Arthrobacter phage Tenno]|uniref:Uncharacterized protein n=1 Tax=Arthrobacter phage Tenno TaxID=2315702 RepID=A0A386KPD8_9CAUD|nr:hypothetical protein SEA_TENNO_83 [Arthrobacter phage Tenno]
MMDVVNICKWCGHTEGVHGPGCDICNCYEFEKEDV